jgi:hypothetical protein
MTTEEQKSIEALIGKLADKNYSSAKDSLQDAVAEKIKIKIRSFLEQEK